MNCKSISLICFLGISSFLFSQNSGLSPQIINVNNRAIISLDGYWKTIVDPFENGYYDYRLNPSKTGYFLDKEYKDKTRLQEYDFSLEKSLHVPGD